jgi:carbon storage regulator CsrA
MLVLTRRAGQKIVFPTINAVVHVVASKSGLVRLGIEAPDTVPVFREEILASQPVPPVQPPQTDTSDVLRKLVHQLNNRLNGTTVGAALLRRQLDLGMVEQGTATLGKIEQELAVLRQTIEDLVPRKAPPAQQAPRARALLVEDDANECELLAGFLRLAGLEVATAGDGADALDHLSTHDRPDVVLLDMFLPRCDGPTTLRAIRGNPANAGIKVFGVTGADPQRLNLPEGPSGVDRWFRKPLNPEAILRELGLTASR